MRGLVLAAPSSGSGKSVVALAILRALKSRGLVVAAAKAGPDYIDAAFLAAASGGPCRNLDSWAMRRATIAATLAALAPADFVLVEGAMGLFDGIGAGGEGSTASLAKRLGWPIVLVADAQGAGASLAALVAGFARHRADTVLSGVILNRVGSARHRTLLADALAAELPDLPLLGALPRDRTLELPSRHLGLVQAMEHDALDAFLDRAAALAAAHLDLDRCLALGDRNSHLSSSPRKRGPRASDGAVALDPRFRGGDEKNSRLTNADHEVAASPPVPPLGARIAVARDAAFAFAYPMVLDGWRQGGAEIVFFSPLADEAPDHHADAVYLPGGYPELHAGRLAAAARFRQGLAAAASRGAAIYGECGGYMVLGAGLVDEVGARHAMTSLLPLETSFCARRLHLGYRQIVLDAEGPLGAKGADYRGHEFHYATIIDEGAGAPLFHARDGIGAPLGAMGRVRGRVMGSFVHLIDRAP